MNKTTSGEQRVEVFANARPTQELALLALIFLLVANVARQVWGQTLPESLRGFSARNVNLNEE